MNIDNNKIWEKLKTIPCEKPKVREKESLPEKPIQSISSVKLENQSITLGYIVISFLAFLALVLIIVTRNNVPIVSNPTQHKQVENSINLISNSQADEIKSLVKEVSACQNKAPITVHNDLKKIFKYYSYREIDQLTYDKVMTYLKSQNCQ